MSFDFSKAIYGHPSGIYDPDEEFLEYQLSAACDRYIGHAAASIYHQPHKLIRPKCRRRFVRAGAICYAAFLAVTSRAAPHEIVHRFLDRYVRDQLAEMEKMRPGKPIGRVYFASFFLANEYLNLAKTVTRIDFPRIEKAYALQAAKLIGLRAMGEIESYLEQLKGCLANYAEVCRIRS